MRIALLLSGCMAIVSGQAKIDGAPFAPTHCRSGAVYGFSGIELADEHDKVRLVNDPMTGDTRVALFVANERGVDLGACGTLRQSWQGAVVNGVQVQEGAARLACARVQGELEFQNCH